MADVVICGAGIAGVAAAHHLRRLGVADVVLVDERAPLTLTSDKGTEAYRNWWPGPDDAMVRFMSRSIDLLEEHGSEVALNRHGYAFLTADPARIPGLEREAREISALGAGPVRVDAYDENARDGADLVTDPAAIRARYPFLARDVAGMLHARRCGWLDAKRLGAWLLATSGARVVRDRVTGFDRGTVELASGTTLAADAFVVAAGPLLGQAGAMLGLDLPVFCELHGKMAVEDPGGVVPRACPMMIWIDPVDGHPGGFHFRTRAARELLAIWTYDARPVAPAWPPAFDPDYGPVLLRGLARMVPGLSPAPGPIDGGYYCRTRENRPLIGPLPVDGAYVIGALSGFGIMGAHAAGELLALHVTGGALPDYAPAFLLSRYDDPDYAARFDGRDGQL